MTIDWIPDRDRDADRCGRVRNITLRWLVVVRTLRKCGANDRKRPPASSTGVLLAMM